MIAYVLTRQRMSLITIRIHASMQTHTHKQNLAKASEAAPKSLHAYAAIRGVFSNGTRLIFSTFSNEIFHLPRFKMDRCPERVCVTVSKGRVTALCAHPEKNSVVTCCSDGAVQVNAPRLQA